MSEEKDTGGHGRLRPSGGYRKLRAFQTTTVVYDGTVAFCDKFIRSHRQYDQMTQAARTGRQNIGEGSRAAAVSAESELKLVNVARSSQDELLLDYEDFLRQKKHRQWGKDEPAAMEVRMVAKGRADEQELTYQDYARWLDHEDPGQRANCLICLIHQANFLLDRLITRLEQDIIKEGGYREQLTKARLAERDKQQGLPPQPQETPNCPKCGKPMRLRTARQGRNTGSRFWGCAGYPDCTGTMKYQPKTDRTDLADSPEPSDGPADPA